jgi:predicted LPLAT superfamily acyltransferase
MLADRALYDDRIVTVPFFGRPANFPAGPILTAALLRVPVVLFFSLYRGGRRYTLHFEQFAELVELSRDNRAHDIERYVARFAARLEHYCRLAPYNWFNFFDFWAMAEDAPPHAAQRSSRSGTHA